MNFLVLPGTFKRIAFVLMIVTPLFTLTKCNCGKQEDDMVPPCNMPSAFKKLYEANLTAHAGYSDVVTMDLQTHEYRFRPHSNKTICKVGYEGNAALFTANIPYLIEILDANGNVLYSGNHRFASGQTDYQDLGTPVPVTAGLEYTIRRTVNNPAVSLDKLTGRLMSFNLNPGTFPTVTYGIIDILGSNFYGRGGPVPNYGIPFIDIVF
jgi:hypothetical protein